ncbi:MAG: SPOR domain-containing protein [Rhodobacteraceae bacterium]|nr:SPOR domain-containing protein [Paracoccaceae bacterium]
MRAAPQAPGGRQAAHQGLSVNEIAANGTAAPPAERVVLAPPPLDLAASDRPVATAPRRTAAGTAAAATTNAAMLLPADAPHDAVVVRASLAAAASSPAMTAAAAPPAPGGPDAATAALDADKRAQAAALAAEGSTRGALANVLDAALAEALGTEGQMRRSPRPRARPDRGETRLASADDGAGLRDVVALSAPAAPLDPAALPPGTRLVQLGAFPTKAEAEQAWDALAVRFADFLDTRHPVLQPAEANGAPFWRLRAMGFADDGDARRFCAALVAENASCIPVLIR